MNIQHSQGLVTALKHVPICLRFVWLGPFHCDFAKGGCLSVLVQHGDLGLVGPEPG